MAQPREPAGPPVSLARHENHENGDAWAGSHRKGRAPLAQGRVTLGGGGVLTRKPSGSRQQGARHRPGEGPREHSVRGSGDPVLGEPASR